MPCDAVPCDIIGAPEDFMGKVWLSIAAAWLLWAEPGTAEAQSAIPMQQQEPDATIDRTDCPEAGDAAEWHVRRNDESHHDQL